MAEVAALILVGMAGVVISSRTAGWSPVGVAAWVGFAACTLLIATSFVGSGLWLPGMTTDLAAAVGYGLTVLAVAAFFTVAVGGRRPARLPAKVALIGVGLFAGCTAIAAASAGAVNGVPDKEDGHYFFSEEGRRREVDREFYEDQVVRIRRGDYALAAAGCVPGIVLGMWGKPTRRRRHDAT